LKADFAQKRSYFQLFGYYDNSIAHAPAGSIRKQVAKPQQFLFNSPIFSLKAPMQNHKKLFTLPLCIKGKNLH
jgi:hypothetical protein